MQRRAILATLGLVGTVGTAGCLTRITNAGEPYDIGMSANAFEPYRFTVDPGETVVWLNNGSRAHTVTAYGRGIPDGTSFFATGNFANEDEARAAWHDHRGGNIYASERFSHTFTEPGRYPYFCVPHELGGMLGEIVVSD